jgi:hypothetical protein
MTAGAYVKQAKDKEKNITNENTTWKKRGIDI